MIEAEERGITSANVDEMLKSADPNVKRMLGVTPRFGPGARLDEKWAYNVIKQVGNYGESFDRNVGMGLQAEAAAGSERSVDPRRADVLAAVPLTEPRRAGSGGDGRRTGAGLESR